jgi:methionine-rich copper-binding protein CopC
MEMRIFPMRIPRTFAVLAALVALAAPSAVAAHAELVSSTPASGDVLDAPPAEVVLVFDDELDPAASGFTVTDADGGGVGSGEVDLDVAERNELRGTVDIGGLGSHTVRWSVTGADGHGVEGTFDFEVRATDGDDEVDAQPDTAMAPPGEPNLLVIVGLVLVVVAAVLVGIRLRRAAG